jgi:hypothetical protein
MKPQPKLLFIVVILFSFTLFSSRCSYFFFIGFPLRPEQNLYKNIILLKILGNYLSNEWSFALNGGPRKKLCPFYFTEEEVMPVLLYCRVLSRKLQNARPLVF